MFLMLHEKLLTREVMITRCFNIQDSTCPLCTSCDFETAHHLFFNCNYSRQIWSGIGLTAGTGMVVQGDSMGEVWRKSTSRFARDSEARIRWQCLFSSACWTIWRQRNYKVFGERVIPPDVITEWIVGQASLWERHCQGRKKRVIIVDSV